MRCRAEHDVRIRSLLSKTVELVEAETL